jgi:hypothetical protein
MVLEIHAIGRPKLTVGRINHQYADFGWPEDPEDASSHK